MVKKTGVMNLHDSSPKPLWTQPLHSYSGSATDSHERTAILSSFQSIGPRVKRPKTNHDSDEPSTATTTPWKQAAHVVSNDDDDERHDAESKKPELQMRPLSLDRGAVAPGLARPTAPFAKSERKRAYVSAIYYAECYHRGIRPKDADTAAFDIQNQYTKWWVQSKGNSTKKRKLDDATMEARQPEEKETHSISLEQAPPLTDDEVSELKERLVENLRKTGGDTTTTEFRHYCEQLQTVYKSKPHPERFCRDGTWLTLSKPTFSECQGRNENGEYMYTLGRMSFDMFRPTHLKCSIRAVMNNIRVMDPRSKPRSFPSRLAKELQGNVGASENPIRHYDIVVAFTIQAGQTRQGTTPTSDDEFVVPREIRGLMTNHGYMVADPNDSGRSSIWFSGGSIEVQDEVNDSEIWKQIFDDSLAPRRDMRSMANLLAAKVLLGAYTTTDSESPRHVSDDSDNAAPSMNYYFKRPIGGHGEVYCDALYEDETLRIMQGHRGSVFVFNRVPSHEGCEDEEGGEHESEARTES